MADILEGVVTEVVDGDTLELEVERVVEAQDAGRYGAIEMVRFAGDGTSEMDEEAAAAAELGYENRRVRCYVLDRDEEGRIIGEIEVLGDAKGLEPRYGVDADGE